MKFNQSIICSSLIIALSGYCSNAFSEEQQEEWLEDISLEALFAINSDIASNTERSIFEQPSIISIIERDQLLRSGARDLIDVLRMVPGFGFAHDTAGINSWGFRGVWGHEGKIMLMIDGAPYNDPAWGNLQFGKHYPIDLISKIEIIRGPGAAKFGNYAELAVVRITTLANDKDFEGSFVSANVRALDTKMGSQEINGTYKKALSEDSHISAQLHTKSGNRTVLPFTDTSKTIVTDQNNSPIEVFTGELSYTYKDIKVGYLNEQYNFEHNESLLQVPDPGTVINQSYEREHISLDYDHEVNEDLSVSFSYLNQEVMSHDMSVKTSNEFTNIGSHYRIETERDIFALDALYSINENSSISAGIEYFEVDGFSANIGEYFADPLHLIEGNSTDFTEVWFLGSQSYNFDQHSIFVQYENYNDILNYTIGARYADHSEATETVLVPRVGVSKEWDNNFGFKAMYSEAFRTGDAEHLNLASSPLKPETLKSTEVELHYLHESGLYTVNFFNMIVNDPIVFNTDALTENFEEIKSSGYEASWIKKSDNYTQEITLSYYRGKEGSVPPQLARNEKSYLGFPNTKFTWKLDYFWSENLTITPSIMYEGEKYWRADIADISKDTKLSATTLVNINATYIVNENMTVNMAIHDILDEGYVFPQAYGQVLYPGDSREISLGVKVKF